MDILQIQAELLRREYPHLLPNEDPDIERYFFLRNSGQSQEALNLYQLKLKPRYPDDEFRTTLLRLYRNRNPAYRELQTRAYQVLGVRCLEKMKRLIVFVADRADSYNSRDAYSTIRAAELIKQVLPQERYEATAAIERLFRYSQVLNLRTQSMYRAAELIRAYLSDTLTVVDEERRRRDDVRKRAIEERRRRLSDLDVSTYGWDNRPAPLSDLMNAVVFSSADLARIEIPKTITKPEDKTLAFCAKYWNHTGDQAFERLLFLYSRKFGAKNYDVFKAIQRGRQNNKRDDEILASVMSCIITGYYYSVMGDRYLQQQWSAIKAKLLSSMTQPAAAPKPATPTIAARPAITAPGAVASPVAKPTATPKPATKPAAQTAAAKPTAAPGAVASPATQTAATPTTAPRPTAAARPKPAAQTTATKPATVAPRSAVPTIAARPTATTRPAVTPRPPASTIATKPIAATRPKPAAQPAITAPRPPATTRPKLAAQPTAARPATAAPGSPAPPVATTRPTATPRPTTPTIAAKPTAATRPKPAAQPTAARPATAAPGSPAPPVAATRPTATPRPATPTTATKPATVAPRPAAPAEKPRVSVSQRLQELSGRSYDVFQDRFLAHVRPAIRKVLGANRGIFFNLPLQAEDIVFNFLKTHYNDPYMNWEDSDDRARLAKMGFELNSIIPVIDECYGML